jgi:hypothetical protein
VPRGGLDVRAVGLHPFAGWSAAVLLSKLGPGAKPGTAAAPDEVTVQSQNETLDQASALMADFAHRTGLTSALPPRRYLWTDAFAVCNFLALARATGESSPMDSAVRLVDQVHHVLGRYRPDDARRGWISGLGERDGEEHPTCGGLRIGKPLPERGTGEPLDPELEWDRDGQYFHYLTKWMHALDQVAGATRDPRFHRWARELASTGHGAFVHGSTRERRMRWKMSTDLTRALVSSQGQHDPLDGFLTCVQLASSAALLRDGDGQPDLSGPIEDFAALLAASDLRTTDPLGLGGLLVDAFRIAELAQRDVVGLAPLLERVLEAAEKGLALVARRTAWDGDASGRLAFRELGLAIGLAGLERLAERIERGVEPALSAELRSRVRRLSPGIELGTAIRSYWLRPESRRSSTRSEHRDIDEVMLATSLVPDGFLVLAARRGERP